MSSLKDEASTVIIRRPVDRLKAVVSSEHPRRIVVGLQEPENAKCTVRR